MRRAALTLSAAALLALGAELAAAAERAPFRIDEVRIAAGSYYVGRATGERDYRAIANATTPGFLVMRGEVTQGLVVALSAWGTLHGYVFEAACTACARDQPDKPAGGVGWRDAALLANALSEAQGLDPVYRDGAGQPIRVAVPPDAIDRAIVEPTLSGYRLPTIPEWHIALRGADKALAAGTYGTTETSPNALGLIDTAGPFSEWTASTMDLGCKRPSHFYCNAEVDGVRRLSTCDIRSAGGAGATTGFRFVRKAP